MSNLALLGGTPVREKLFPAHKFIAKEEKAAESFIRCLLEEHGAPQTLVLPRQSLGSALDASALGAASPAGWWSSAAGAPLVGSAPPAPQLPRHLRRKFPGYFGVGGV